MTSSCIKPFPSCLLPAVPRGGPHIQGYKTEVSLGDELQLNCTSLKSKPAAKLQFYINNKVSPTTLFGADFLALPLQGEVQRLQEENFP